MNPDGSMDLCFEHLSTLPLRSAWTLQHSHFVALWNEALTMSDPGKILRHVYCICKWKVVDRNTGESNHAAVQSGAYACTCKEQFEHGDLPHLQERGSRVVSNELNAVLASSPHLLSPSHSLFTWAIACIDVSSIHHLYDP